MLTCDPKHDKLLITTSMEDEIVLEKKRRQVHNHFQQIHL